MADQKTTANYSLFHDLRRFGVEALCLLMLLYGAPLQALDSITEPKSSTTEASTTADDPSWVEPVLETAGQSLNAVQDEVRQLALDVASQPWTDAFGLLFTAPDIGASGAGSSSGSAPPSPPKDAARPSKDYDLASLAAGFSDKNALDAVPLLPGWNQVSLPEVPASSDPASVLAAIGGSYHKVYTYNCCDATDPWKVYDPNDLAASDLTTIDVEQGLLIDATAAVSLPSDGTLPDSTTIQLCTGWNLIGFPSAYPRHVKSALAPILDKVVRVYAFDPFDLADNWKFYEASAPAWASDLDTMLPGMGYWVLVTEDVQLEIKNVGDAPSIAFTSPQDLDVITAPTEIQGTVASDLLESWQLRYRGIGEADWVELANGNYPVQGKLGDFDPTLLLNGMYELELVATDLQGQQVTDSIALVVEGNMKIGHFTLSFVDLAIPLSGLDIQVVRTYDSRQRHLQGDFAGNDFGPGWSLDIRQGSYRNNRPPGDGWRIPATEGPWGLPCSTVQELKSHLTTVRLSDQEVYRFRLTVKDPGTIIGGCIGRAEFDFVDGPVPGATLEILGNDSVLYQNNSDELRDPNSFALFVPEDVKLTTRDGRIFHLDLADGVTHLEDLNGNTLEITPEGITHSSGRGVEFERDAEGRIERIIDPMGNANVYAYDDAGDHVSFTDRIGAVTTFAYADGHYLEDIVNALGVRAVRTEYDDDGRMVRVIDAAGKVVALDHDLDARREVVTNRLGFVRVMEYDGRGNVVREVDELGAVTLRTFDGRDNLLTEQNPLGHTTTSIYDVSGNLMSVTDPLGHVTRFTYDERGKTTSVTDPRGKATTNFYDARGNLTSTTDPLGAVTSFTYDTSGQQIRQADALGNITSFAHDSFGNQISTTNALGHETSAAYDTNSSVTAQTSSRTRADGTVEILTTDYGLDAQSRVTTTTFPDGATTRTTYDALGNLLTTTDPLGHSTTFSYDVSGRRSETSYADGTSERREYDAEGQLVAVVDRSDHTATFAYDATGRLISTTFPDDSVITSNYDAAGQLVASTDARGFATHFAYDAAGRRVSVEDALGAETLFGFDANGSQTSITDALGNTKTQAYDDVGRLISTTLADGSVTRNEYDPLGRRIVKIDASGLRTEYVYDALGRLIQVKDALGSITGYAYDERGQRIRQTDANGHITRFEFDKVGRQTARILPDGKEETFAYDAVGNRLRRTDFAGSTTLYSFDVNHRLTRRTYDDGSFVALTYTPTGQRAVVTDARGVTRYSYDNRERLISLTAPEGWTMRYGWDTTSNRTTVTADLGEQGSFTTAYTFDAKGRMATVTDPQGGVYTYDHDAAGRQISLSYPNGVATTWQHDAVGRLTGIHTEATDGTVIQDYTYTFDPNGNRRAVVEEDGTNRSWEYDAAYRLTRERVTDSEDHLKYENSFMYDSVGNRLQQVRSAADGASQTIVYTYDFRDRLLTETINGAVTVTYTWDPNGNQMSKTATEGTTQYGWDFENRLISATLPDGTVVKNVYDVDGVRMLTSAIDAAGHLAYEAKLVTDTSGSLSQLLAEIDQDSSPKLYTWSNRVVASSGATGARYLHKDSNQSTRVLTTESSQSAEEYTYEAFGDFIDSPEHDPSPFLFSGEPYDQLLGLNYHRARWLNTDTGRFTSMDPWMGVNEDPISLHRYLYGNASPTNYADPTGEFSETLAGQLGSLSVHQEIASISILSIAAIDCATSALGQGERNSLCFDRSDDDEDRKTPIRLYRGIKKLKPSRTRWRDFRFDDVNDPAFPIDGTARGLSVFELPTPTHPVHLPFDGHYFGFKVPGTVATITSVGGLPFTASARYTPIPDGTPDIPIGFHPLHWDLDVPLPKEDAMHLLQDLAREYLRSLQ